MDLFRNGTDKTGTGQVPFTRQILSEPFVFLSEPFQFFRSCKRPFSVVCGPVQIHRRDMVFPVRTLSLLCGRFKLLGLMSGSGTVTKKSFGERIIDNLNQYMQTCSPLEKRHAIH